MTAVEAHLIAGAGTITEPSDQSAECVYMAARQAGGTMINLKVNDADRILIVEMKGMISEADIDGAIDALQAKYPAVGVHLRGGERGGFSMLVDWQDLEGWEKGAKTLGTLTTKTIGDAVRKIAVIAGAQFLDEQPRLADVAKQAVVRFFPPGHREHALAWLRNR
jgi:hypothetical protein